MLKKIKRRYLALKIDSNQTFSSKELMDTIWSALVKLYGEYGASRAGLTLINYDAEKGIAVIRAIHTEVEKVRAALASITKMQDKPVAMHVLTVSGTIRSLYKKATK